MKLQTILDLPECKVLVKGNPDREISKVFCCDLLSIAMGRAPADCAWVTVMGNMNTLAVASLADVSCVVLAEGKALDEASVRKAEEQGISVLASERPIFETALEIYRLTQ